MSCILGGMGVWIEDGMERVSDLRILRSCGCVLGPLWWLGHVVDSGLGLLVWWIGDNGVGLVVVWF